MPSIFNLVGLEFKLRRLFFSGKCGKEYIGRIVRRLNVVNGYGGRLYTVFLAFMQRRLNSQ